MIGVDCPAELIDAALELAERNRQPINIVFRDGDWWMRNTARAGEPYVIVGRAA